MNATRSKMTISPLWLQISVLTFLAGFAVLVYLAIALNREQPPLPQRARQKGQQLLFQDNSN